MIKLDQLQTLLKTNEKDLEKMDIDQLRTTVGVFRYLVRTFERELNRRCVDKPLGNIFE